MRVFVAWRFFVSSADFRHIAVKGKARKADRLFRAAVSAFCALTRPSRREVTQLEELTLSLFDQLSADSKRYASAALSESEHAPSQLIRRLCEEPVEIAAPLLIRSRSLTDIDLIALIARHGRPHARAIGRRQDLHPSIASLVRAMHRPTEQAASAKSASTPAAVQRETWSVPTPVAAPLPDDAQASSILDPHVPDPFEIGVSEEIAMDHDASITKSRMDEAQNSAPSASVTRAAFGERQTQPDVSSTGGAAERMRQRLRGVMLDASGPAVGPAGVYQRLKMTALTGAPAFFQTALADALEIDFSIACNITESGGYTSLAAAMRTLDLSDEQAFLLACAVFPTFFSHPEAIRLFVQRFRTMHREAAMDMLRGWRAETAARNLSRSAPRADNNAERPVATVTKLRA